MKKFKLFMGYWGNGLTVCNKAIEKNGDYITIAHIADCGKITWYVNPASYVPGAELLKIEHEADTMRANWEKWLASMPEMERYSKLLDRAPHAAFMHVCGNKKINISEKIAYLIEICYEQSRF